MTITKFLSAFFPDETEPIRLRAFMPRGVAGYAKKIEMTRARDKALRDDLAALNKARGIYFVVNAGGDCDAAITGGEERKDGKVIAVHPPGRFNACFAEADDLTIEEQHAKLDACPLPPSIRVETKKSVHAYWLLAGDNPGDKCADDWRKVQVRFIAYFDSDEKIKNPSRVMRVPGFDHVSADGSRKRVECVTFEPEQRYTLAELLAEFPPVPEEKRAATRNTSSVHAGQFATWDALRAELGRHIIAHESAEKNGSGKYDCRGICHDGKGNTGLFYDPATNQAYCNKDCDQATILRAFNLPEKLVLQPKKAKSASHTQDSSAEPDEPGESREEAEGRRQTKASLAVELAAAAELFHNAEGKTFARVSVGAHFETWPLKSSSFKKWLGARFWQEHKATIHPPAIAEALLTLEGRATYEGEQREVFTRIAEHDGAIYLDLCNDNWRVVEVKATGWRVIEAADCPVRFRRTSGMLPLPEPVGGGNLRDLRALLNLSEENQPQWVLILAWLIAAFRPGAPYPVLAVHGEQGSAKSTTCRMLRALIDPNTAALRSAPKEERDLMIAASNSHVVAFDNLTRVSESMSDAICRISTGGGFATRELYSNDEEVIFDLKRPILLNGITEIATKSDLLDRSILVYLPQIADDKRREESEIWEEFNSAKPHILGALLEAVCTALRELPKTKLERLPRMADFARWATAAETGLGLEAGAFFKAYTGNRSEANDLALEASPVAAELREAFKDQSEWEGSSAALLRLLTARLEARNENPKMKAGWPQSPKGLTDRLKVLAPNLRAVGLEVQPGRVRGRSLVKIRKTSASSASSAKVQSMPDLSCGESFSSGSERCKPFATEHANDANGRLTGNGICNGLSHSQEMTFADDADGANEIPVFTRNEAREVFTV